MMRFCYYARTDEGAAVQGRMTAPNLQAVAEHLRARTLTAIDIRPQNRFERLTAPIRQASLGANTATALRTLATLLQVGLPLRRAIEIVTQATRSNALREGFRAVIAAVMAGESLAEAMQCRSDLFTPMTIALVRAGERGGTLPETLERHAENLEKRQALQRRMTTTMIYPLIVLCTALGLIAFLLLTVLPMFASLFDQLHVEQPVLLRVLLGVSAACNPTNVFIALCAVAAMGVALAGMLRRGAVHAPQLTARLRRLPVIGALREKAATARFTRALATLLRAGVPLPEALVCVRPIVGTERMRSGIDRIGEALRDGNSLASATQAQGVFDPLLVHLMHVGEETGTLDAQLFRVADWFERDFAEAAARAAALIEPLLIVGIGTLVGAIVFSVFVPLYSLIGGIG